MHTGTIIAAKNESELAGVMAHEIGHVAQRHIARMIESQQGNLALTLGSILLAILAARAGGNSGGHAAAAIAMGSQAAMIQSQLNYSQDAEREADRVGLQTLYSAGFDPKGMEGFFARLQANNHFYESAAPAYLSTHPLTVERMADMELRAEVLQETTIDGRQRLLREFNRRLKSAKGKEVYALQYGISVVQGELGNRGAARRAAEASIKYDANSAILTRNLIRTRFDAAQTQAEKEKILGDARAAASRFPLSAMMQSNVIDLLYALGRHEEIIRTLRSGSALSDADPDYHALLARSYEALGKRSLQYQHTGEMYALLGATEAAVYQYSLAQKANDGDFYTMSEIDARLRELRAQHEQELKDRNG